MRKMSRKKFSDETMKKVKWVVKMYREWRECRDDDNSIVDLGIKWKMWIKLHFFKVCVVSLLKSKRLDGSEFPGKTLYDIVICVQFHMETCGFNWRLLSNDEFKRHQVHLR